MVNRDDQSNRLWIGAFDLELHAEDCAVDMPKIRFSANTILTGRCFDNPSDDIIVSFHSYAKDQ